MPQVTYIEPAGTEQVIDVPEGWTLMQAAVGAGVEGIEAECGGSCSCATCHVYVDDAFRDRLSAPGENELAMLGNVVAERQPGSRLSCQIRMTETLAGLRVRMPEAQS